MPKSSKQQRKGKATNQGNLQSLSAAVSPLSFTPTNKSCIPKSIRSTSNDERAREMNRERGISYVAGVVVDLANLLRDFKIENNDPVDMADKIEMVTPLMRPYGCGPVAPNHRTHKPTHTAGAGCERCLRHLGGPSNLSADCGGS